jgi:flagellin-like protein
MKRLLKNKKALSPVVASIILIAVTVAVSIAVAAWMGALTFSFMGTSSINIYNMTFQGTSNTTGNTILLNIKNTGTKTVTVGTVKVNNVVENFTSSPTPCKLTPGATGTITVTVAKVGYNLGWASGNPYAIYLYDTSGNGLGSTQATA